jgi:coiled-coil-helix-coiled-coil-helix domain-containing protein 10
MLLCVQLQAPAPSRAAPPPAAAPAPSGGGGMLSGLGSTIMQGMAFGTGSAIAREAVGAVMGGGSKNSAPAPEQAAAAPAPSQNHNMSGPCADDYKAFTMCVKQNPNDISQCDFYMQSLQACQTAQR